MTGHAVTGRAAIWRGPVAGFTVEDVPLPLSLPRAADGETLVEIELATVCGSDLHTIRGERETPLPTILGHEMVGRVVAGGRLPPGTRVTWSICTSCGACDRCRRGLANKCRDSRKYGHEALTADWALSGGFASHCHLAPGTALVEVPEVLPARLLAPANCATATVGAAVRRAGGVDDGDVVVVEGCGLVGLTAVAYARHLGARDVVACDIDAVRLAHAARVGAAATAQPDELADVVAKMSAGEGADLVLEASGSDAAVRASLSMLAVGGRLALVGSVFPGPTVELAPETMVRGMQTIVGSHNYLPSDLDAAVRFLAETDAGDELASLVSDPFDLADIDGAVAAAMSGRHARVAVRS